MRKESNRETYRQREREGDKRRVGEGKERERRGRKGEESKKKERKKLWLLESNMGSHYIRHSNAFWRIKH